MTAWLLPIAATLAAAGLTYGFCVRPMIRGHHGPAPTPPACCPPPTTAPDLDEQIRQATAERDRLRANHGAKSAP